MALVTAPSGVRVNLLEPGAIDTPFDPPRFPPIRRPDIPLGRMGTADEVAAAIEFLLGPGASYMTGAVLRLDGGRTILGGADRYERSWPAGTYYTAAHLTAQGGRSGTRPRPILVLPQRRRV